MPIQAVATSLQELPRIDAVHANVEFSLLRCLPASLVAIPERFSSSSLPPSFAQGRDAAIFTAWGTATCGTPFCWLNPTAEG